MDVLRLVRQIGSRLVLLTMALAAVFSTPAQASTPPLIVIHPAPESAGDNRYGYYWQLLDQALRETRRDFGPYVIRQASQPMNEARVVHELSGGSGSITVALHGNVSEWEQRLLPVRFPLDKGLLGYRVFLIRKQTQPAFDPVNTLADLRRFTIGQGRNWQDVTILRNAGLNVMEGEDYAGLFDMLGTGRFDLFSRSVTEVGSEVESHRRAHPDLVIERHLILYYPLTRYFYFARSTAGRALARRISIGLERMRKDGTFDKMFRRFVKPFDAEIKFTHRTLISIDNPLLTPEPPTNRRELWYDPYHRQPSSGKTGHETSGGSTSRQRHVSRSGVLREH